MGKLVCGCCWVFGAGDPGDLADRVEQDLSLQCLGDGVREVLQVVAVLGHGDARELVEPRTQQSAGEGLQVEFQFDHVFGQCGQQRLVDRRVRLSQVIDRLDKSAAEVVSPEPVGDGSSEEGVARRCHPVGQHFSAVTDPAEVCRCGGSQGTRRNQLTGAGMFQVASGGHEQGRVARGQ